MKSEKKKWITTLDMVQIALVAAIITVLGFIKIPLPGGVPGTVYALTVSLAGYLFKWYKGLITMIIFLVVFPLLQGGLSLLVGITGGYLWGFIFMILCCSFGYALQQKMMKKISGYIVIGGMSLLGLILCYLAGTIQFCAVTGSTFIAALINCVLPFCIKDVLLMFAGYFLSVTIRKALTSQHIRF